MKSINMTKKLMAIGVFGTGSLLFTGCATAPDNISEIESVRSDYQRVSQNPAYQKTVPSALKDAEKSLDKLNLLVEKGAEEKKIDHQLYLAKRDVEVADELYRARKSQEHVENAEIQRKDLLIEKKEKQLTKVQREAEAAKLAAQKLAIQNQMQKKQLNSMRNKAAELESEVDALVAKETEAGLVLTLSNILFAHNKATLSSGATPTIEKLAGFLNEYPEKSIVIEGYTDSTGAEDYNEALSEDRAEAVSDALVTVGVDAKRLSIKGYGEAKPIASNDTASGRQQNRRVEIVIQKD